MTVGSLLHHAAQRWPDRCALFDDASGMRLTFAQLAIRVFAFGKVLREDLSLPHGARIALLGDAGVDFLCADYAVMGAGMARVSLDPSLSAAELAAQAADAGAALLLFSPKYAQLAAQVAARARAVPIGEVMRRLREDGPAPCVACAPEEIAALNYTGGTTGSPKAVVHTHATLCATLQNIAMARAPWCGDVMLNVRPLWPIAAVSVLAHVVQGGSVVLGGDFFPGAFFRLARVHRATCTSLVPTHLARLLAEDAAASDVSSLRCVEVGAAPIPAESLDRAVALFGRSLSVIYGLTEAPWTCYRTPALLDEVLADLRSAEGLVGETTFGAEIRIGPDDEVLIRGAHVMAGYWNRAELTAEVLRDGWFHTGDVGSIDGRGRLRIRGRLKDLIRTGGKSVQPGEVEAVLCAHPGVLEATVIGVPDAEWGEMVGAAVVARPGCTLSHEELSLHCRAHLSAHKRPKLIELMPALPRSHYGKVQRAKVLAAMQAARPKAP